MNSFDINNKITQTAIGPNSVPFLKANIPSLILSDCCNKKCLGQFVTSQIRFQKSLQSDFVPIGFYG